MSPWERENFRQRIRSRSGGKADALRSGRSVLKDVRVQIPPSAPFEWGLYAPFAVITDLAPAILLGDNVLTKTKPIVTRSLIITCSAIFVLQIVAVVIFIEVYINLKRG